MTVSGDYRRGRHVVSGLRVHLVLVTTYRRGVLTGGHIGHLNAVSATVCSDFGAVLARCNGQDDHVHMLAEHRPKVSVAPLLNSLNGGRHHGIRDSGWAPP
jgi:putative transposase